MVAMEEKPNFFPGDIESILSKIKHQQKQIQQKRRWLLGLSTSEEERNHSKKLKFLDTSSLPESFLREDDIFYETVKSCVEEAFGVRPETGHQVVLDDSQLPGVSEIPRTVSSCIDNLATKGLYLLAKTLTGRTDFEKTRPNMKKVVRESLSLVFGILNPNHHRDHHLMQLSRQIAQLLNDPRNFRDNQVPFLTSRFAIRRAAVKKVLAELETFPQQALVAMYDKLRGMQPRTPQLQPPKNGRCKEYLISRVRKYSKEMLSEVDKGGDLPEPLAKAMAIADLSLKLSSGFHKASATEFYKFSPEVKLLQLEITKAIWLLDTKVGIAELKKVKNLLDPSVEVSHRSMRPAIRSMLTEYLFECGDMDAVPKSLLETLAVINKNQTKPDKRDLKNRVENEMECILNLSAHTKQVVLDLLPANDFDMDFTDAYVEDLEESDDDEHGYGNEDWEIDEKRALGTNISQNSSCHSIGSNQEVESTADSVPFDMKLHTAATTAEEDPCTPALDKRSNSAFVDKLESKISAEVDTANFSFEEPKEMDENNQTTYKNRYLTIQEACDQTSMVAYNLIGHMLGELGRKEGLALNRGCSFYLRGGCGNKEETQEKERASHKESDGMIVVRVTEELIPSFPKR
ncbi:hypothetical protein L484_018107 [Morus notabilis]|uniref:Uncharacterized protein n=1 Tax=Morus notabilis TaxID=981085 RepID=W9QV99_9ROSA|nr:hypothetical protein L484_018107 [Morus notabilis]